MPQKNIWLLPAAIVIAGAVIGLALFFVRAGSLPAAQTGDLSKLRPIDASDHIVGNPQAAVTIIEYSDIDCEYCKQYQEALEQIMADYGANGNVAWVYRHFPLIETHANSALHAEAAECVASLGGGQLFFRFIDALNQAAPDATSFDPRNYASVVSALGLSTTAFDSCIAGNTFEKRVSGDFDNAIAIGANGTPYSLILIRGQKELIPISGALPYPALKQVIETALQKASTP